MINSGLVVRPLLGHVSQSDLIREVVGPRAYDVLWFATHGAEGGVMLSDGLLSGSAIVQLVRHGRFWLAYINSCQSIALAQQIQNETACATIATLMDVPDDDAYRTGALFAHALAATSDAWAAYQRSRPGSNRTYLFLAPGDWKKK